MARRNGVSHPQREHATEARKTDALGKRRPSSRNSVPEQADTMFTTLPKIMLSPYFALGVADVRAGRPPRFDLWDHDSTATENDLWDYERGRQWATAAPTLMPVRRTEAERREFPKSQRRLSSSAEDVYERSKIP